jgi:ribosomal protein S8
MIWKLKNNFGTYILSTPIGFLNDVEARQLNVGGKLICAIY